jgi:hypothetical protein
MKQVWHKTQQEVFMGCSEAWIGDGRTVHLLGRDSRKVGECSGILKVVSEYDPWI